MASDSGPRQIGEALKDVMDAQRVSEGELRDARAARKRKDSQTKYQPGLILLIVAAWGFIGYAWIARPGFLFESQRPTLLTAPQREARLRYAIYLQRARISEFQSKHGRLPESSRDAGPVESGVQYERTTDNSYQVFGSVDGTVLRLSDRMSADSFLGDALRQIPPPPQ